MHTNHQNNDAMRRGLFLTLALAAALVIPAAVQAEDLSGCDDETGILMFCHCKVPAGQSCEQYCTIKGDPAANPPIPDLVTCTTDTQVHEECSVQCKDEAPVQADVLRTHGLSNPLVSATIPDLIGRVVQIFTGIVGSLALLMFVYGGMLWVTSRGNSEQVEKGKKIFTWSTIGLVIIFGAYLILRVLFQTIGATG